MTSALIRVMHYSLFLASDDVFSMCKLLLIVSLLVFDSSLFAWDVLEV